jgi:hypothetical protein
MSAMREIVACSTWRTYESAFGSSAPSAPSRFCESRAPFWSMTLT